LIELFLFYNST